MNDLVMTAEELKKHGKMKRTAPLLRGGIFHISTGATKKRIVFRGITKKSSAASLRMK